jgi:nucleotide-binding universal stress UspA family protein
MASHLDNTAENLGAEEIALVAYDITRILLPTDGSATAVEATDVAIAIAKRFGAEVVACFVDQGRMVEPIEEDTLEVSEGVHHSTAGLHFAQRLAEKNGVRLRTIVAEGAVAHAILTVQREEECDAIVIGHTGRSALKRAMLGSVAEAVVRDADVPVLVIKHCSTKFCTAVRTDG